MSKPFEVIVFTDGACSGNPGPGGWACILRHVQTGKEKTLAGGRRDTTNNRMELMAAIEGLAALKRAPLRVEVVTDSQYLARGVHEWMPRWRANGWRKTKTHKGKIKAGDGIKNVDLWKRLSELCDQHEVVFTHVAGHAGHPENEECDRLAVEAAQAAAAGAYETDDRGSAEVTLL